MSSIHDLLKQVYPLNLRMELFNAIWTGWRADIKEKDQQIADLEAKLAELKQQLKDTEESYNNTMRYLNKTRSELLNLHKKI